MQVQPELLREDLRQFRAFQFVDELLESPLDLDIVDGEEARLADIRKFRAQLLDGIGFRKPSPMKNE